MMENQRTILFAALALILYVIYSQWQQDYAPKPAIEENRVAQTQQDVLQEDDIDYPSTSEDEVPEVSPTASQLQISNQEMKKATKGKTIEVVTDLFNVHIDTYKGSVVFASLRDYPVSIEQKDVLFSVLDKNADNRFVVESGFVPLPGSEESVKKPIFTADANKYALQEGSNELRVPLTWVNDSGLSITKTLIFKRGTYVIDVEQKLTNMSSKEWKGSLYGRLRQQPVEGSSGGMFGGARSFTGVAVSTDFKKYEKVTFEDISESWSHKHENAGKNGFIKTKSGWIAMLQHYFLVAWIPEQDKYSYISSKFAKNSNNHYISYATGEKVVEPGNSAVFTQTLYVGPKNQGNLKEIAPNLERTVDYGPLFFIAEPLFIGLEFIHGILGNWGWAIIFLTLLIKLVFFKLSEKSYRSMAKMRNLAPKIKQLKERFGDDKQKMNQATMELYKTEGANPLGGCLPILIQMPVFLSLYWMLMESVELRQAPFMFWIVDLSLKDPFYILPVIMGATMLIQQRLNPAPADPVQAKVMMLMPIIFTVMFLWFPAGLVLYWVVNNTLSILQQWVITKKVESGAYDEADKKKKQKKLKKKK